MNRYPGRNVSDKEDFNMRFGGRLAEVEDLTTAISNASGLLDDKGKKAVDSLEEAAGLAKRLSVTVELEGRPKLVGDLETALAKLRGSPAEIDKIVGVTRVVEDSIPPAQRSQDLAKSHPQGDGDASGTVQEAADT